MPAHERHDPHEPLPGSRTGDTLLVVLTHDELAHATRVGEQRTEYALSRRWRGGAGQPRWKVREHNVLGACGECAASKGTGLPWEPVAGLQRGAADVGPYEVRTRPADGYWKLIIRPPVEPDALFLLVVQWTPHDYELGGWCCGADALAIPLESPNDRPPAHWVPYENLISMATRLDRG